MKLWWKKIELHDVGIEPGTLLVIISRTNHYTNNTDTRDSDTEVFTPGTIPRLNLGQYPG